MALLALLQIKSNLEIDGCDFFNATLRFIMIKFFVIFSEFWSPEKESFY